MSERAIGMVRSAGPPARMTSEMTRSRRATTISVEWSVARTRAVPSVSA